MKESFPSKNSGLDGAEEFEVAAGTEGFDREAEWEKATAELNELLGNTEIDADVPAEYELVAKLEKVLAEDLNPEVNPEVDNSKRFVVMAASSLLDKALREDLSQAQFEKWSLIKMKKRTAKMLGQAGLTE